MANNPSPGQILKSFRGATLAAAKEVERDLAAEAERGIRREGLVDMGTLLRSVSTKRKGTTIRLGHRTDYGNVVYFGGNVLQRAVPKANPKFPRRRALLGVRKFTLPPRPWLNAAALRRIAMLAAGRIRDSF